MRLWHKDLIPCLPHQQLLGQWRELCLIAKNIAEKGTPNHVLVNRCADYPLSHLTAYAAMVSNEMKKRGWRCNWTNFSFYIDDESFMLDADTLFADWHTDRYLRQCLYNLQEKADCGAVPPEEWKRIENHFKEYLK